MGSRFQLLQQLQQRAIGTSLRAVAAPLPLPAVHAAPARQLARQLLATMEREQGVGLAAPQVGQSLRMFAAQLDEAYEHDGEDEEGSAAPLKPRLLTVPTPSVIVNPRIIWSSSAHMAGVEGCLSLPGLLGVVSRPRAIRVGYIDALTGQHVEDLTLTGFRARIFMHELDHLNGILFIDKLSDPKHLMTEAAYDQRTRL